MRACCPFCRTWNATYEYRDVPANFQGPFHCGDCGVKLTVDGFYRCAHCGGVLLLTVPRGQSLRDLLRALPRALLVAALVTAAAAMLRLSISQELLIIIAAGIMGAALLLWLFRMPLLRLASLPTKKHARPAPGQPILHCGNCGLEAPVE